MTARPSSSVEDDPVESRVLSALARSQSIGMHFYGQLLGIEAISVGGEGARLRMTAGTGGGSITASAGGIATIADAALSAAVRARLEPNLRTSTVSMSVRHIASPRSGFLTADAVPVVVVEAPGLGLARCSVHDASGHLVGVCDAWFLARRTSVGTLRPMPWDVPSQPEVPPVHRDTLEDDEEAMVSRVVRAARLAMQSDASLVAELLNVSWHENQVIGASGGSTPIGAEITNRVGQVHGGALYGAAALAASRAAGAGATLIDGHVQYLRAAEGAVLGVEARVTRPGRRITFVESTLDVDGRHVVAGRFTFKQEPA